VDWLKVKALSSSPSTEKKERKCIMGIIVSVTMKRGVRDEMIKDTELLIQILGLVFRMSYQP
jgi:hypothetical protein